MPKFPYGKVPFWILLIAILTGIFNLVIALSKRGEKPDLVFVSFARSHMEGYEEAGDLGTGAAIGWLLIFSCNWFPPEQ